MQSVLTQRIYTLLIIAFWCVICAFIREQNPEDRPTFTSIVDELYELEKEIPDAKYSDVSALRCSFLINFL